MSNIRPRRKRKIVNTKRFIAIVASRYNEKYVDGLVHHASAELRALAPKSTIAVHRVPGAFEVPIVVREIARQGKAAAIIAVGLILQGRTRHAEHLARSVTDALQLIAVEYGIPVINVVLSPENELQAQERCLGKRMNRGTEAAHAALEVAQVISQLRSSRAK